MTEIYTPPSMEEARDESKMPVYIRMLPRCPKRGIPVPYFVGWVNGEPEFRAADQEKLVKCVKERLCWVCGQKLGRYMTAVIGPMCSVNRISAEPPSHLDCARWSARNCTFLSRPKAKRREDEFIESCPEPAGEMIRRNPGVTLLWTMRDYRVVRDPRSPGYLFSLGDATSTEWWCEGRKATREEVEESIHTGLPALEAMADKQPGAREKLTEMVKESLKYLPAE